MALCRAIAETHHPFAAVAQVVCTFLQGLGGNRSQGFIRRILQGPVVVVIVGIDEELPHRGEGKITHRQFHDMEITELPFVTEIRQVILAPALALHLTGVSEQHTGAPDQVQRGIGHGQVFFQERAVTAPFR